MLLPEFSLDSEQEFRMVLFANVLALIITGSYALIIARSFVVIRLRLVIESKRASTAQHGELVQSQRSCLGDEDDWLNTCLCCLMARTAPSRAKKMRLTQKALSRMGCPQFAILSQYNSLIRTVLLAFVVRVCLLCVGGGADSVPDWFRGAVYAPGQISNPERLVSPLYYGLYWFMDELASNSLLVIALRPTPSPTAIRQSFVVSVALSTLAATITAAPFVASRLQLDWDADQLQKNGDTWQYAFDIVMLTGTAAVYLVVMSLHGFALRIRRFFWPYMLLQATWRLLYIGALSDGVYSSIVGVMVVSLKTCAMPVVIIACLADDSRYWRDVQKGITDRFRGQTRSTSASSSRSLKSSSTKPAASKSKTPSRSSKPKRGSRTAKGAAGGRKSQLRGDESLTRARAEPAWVWDDDTEIVMDSGEILTRAQAESDLAELAELLEQETPSGLSVPRRVRLEELQLMRKELAARAKAHRHKGSERLDEDDDDDRDDDDDDRDHDDDDDDDDYHTSRASAAGAASASGSRSIRRSGSSRRARRLSDTIGSLDNLEKEQKIGDGQFATVYLSTTTTGITVAMKVLTELTAANLVTTKSNLAEAKRRLGIASDEHAMPTATYIAAWTEAIACMKFSACEHIVTCYGVTDSHMSNIALVFEYCDGGSLDQALSESNSHRLCVARRLKYSIQIAKAVRYIHAAKTVHCDIKSKNIFLKSTGRQSVKMGIVDHSAVLGDFGLTKTLADASSAAGEEAPVAGTPLYMAPELLQLPAPRPTMAMDIWALGNVLYELWTCNSMPWYHEFEADPRLSAKLRQNPRGACKDMLAKVFADMKRAAKHVPAKPKPPEMRNTESGIGKMFKHLVCKCLSFDPSLRPSADDVLLDLLHIQKRLRERISSAHRLARAQMDWDPFCRDLDTFDDEPT